MILIYQCRVIDCNKSTSGKGMLTVGETVSVWGGRKCKKPVLNFAVNPKLL